MVATGARFAPAVERFTSMGTHAEIQVAGGDPHLLHCARARLEALEARWSRFRPDSEVSALNRAAGAHVAVSGETLLLLERSVAGARATAGRFDPTVGSALLSHGYDRTFGAVVGHRGGLVPTPVVDGSWPMIEIDAAAGTAQLPAGTVFDPGGIGKGLAADLVVTELADQTDAILVNLGGDLRAWGTAPDPEGWIVTVEDPLAPERELARLAIAAGAVATTSRVRRSWETATGEVHHVIDPRTGTSARTGIAAVTVVAAEAWWAEVWATSLLLEGPDGLDDPDGTFEAVIVTDGGHVHATPGLEGTLR